MRKRPIIAAGSALVVLAFGAGIAHADPDPNDPGEMRNWPCGYTFGPGKYARTSRNDHGMAWHRAVSTAARTG